MIVWLLEVEESPGVFRVSGVFSTMKKGQEYAHSKAMAGWTKLRKVTLTSCVIDKPEGEDDGD